MPLGLDIIGGLLSIVVYGLLTFSAYKIFTMSNEISELKEMIKDIRRNLDSGRTPPPASPEALVRAVNTASYSEIIDDAIRSEQQR